MSHKLECPELNCELQCEFKKTDKKKTDWFYCKDCEQWFGITMEGDIIYKR